MSFAGAKEFVRKKFEKENRTQDHDFTHILRVLKYAEMIGKKEKADMRIVRYAALFHDYVRETSRKSSSEHAEQSAKAVENILSRFVNDDNIPRILNAIRAHSRKSEEMPYRIEDKIVWDADKLDGFCPMGAARYIIIGAYRGWTIKKSVKRALKTIEKFNKHGVFYTETGKKLGKEKIKKCIRVCNEILEEAIE